MIEARIIAQSGLRTLQSKRTGYRRILQLAIEFDHQFVCRLVCNTPQTSYHTAGTCSKATPARPRAARSSPAAVSQALSTRSSNGHRTRTTKMSRTNRLKRERDLQHISTVQFPKRAAESECHLQPWIGLPGVSVAQEFRGVMSTAAENPGLSENTAQVLRLQSYVLLRRCSRFPPLSISDPFEGPAIEILPVPPED